MMAATLPEEEGSSSVKKRRLLVVEDNRLLGVALARAMRPTDFEVDVMASAEEALHALEEVAYQVVCADYGLPGLNGIELLGRIKERWPLVQRVLITGAADAAIFEAAVNRSEVFRFVHKPFETAQFRATIQAAFDHHEVLLENERLQALVARRHAEACEHAADLEVKVAERTAQLSRAKREWERTFDAIDQPVAIMAADLTVRRANLSWAEKAGLPVKEVVGQRCHERLFGRSSPCAGCPVRAGGIVGGPVPVEIAAGERTYTARFYQDDGQELEGVVVVYSDVTEERNLQKLAETNAKMTALGQLAGGVAHEINNPLGAILAFAQVMLREPGRSADDLESLQLVEHSARRCKHIVESMLKFSRRSKPNRALMDVNQPLDEALVLFNTALKTHPKVKFERSFAAGLPAVSLDSNQIQQVVLNLLQNALDALPAGAGTIGLSTRLEEGQVLVEVRDSGTGIAPHVLPRLFEPLFSTKSAGHGTGFGLSIAYGIVESHGGRIAVDTRLGEGTVFTVRLPVPTFDSSRSVDS